MNNETKKIATNTLSQIIGRVFVLIISLFSIKLITNYLGAEGTGLYSTIVTYLSLFIVIADFGLFSVAVREISKTPERSKKILTNVFTIRFVSAFAITIISIIIARATNYAPEIKTGVLVASLFPLFNLASSVYDMLFQAKLEMHKVVLAEVVSRFFALIAVALAVSLNLGFFAIVATVSLAAVVNFVAKAIFSRKELGIAFSYDKPIMSQIIKMSLPLGFVFIVNNLYFRVDTLILYYFKGAVDVGIYSVSYRVLETTLFAGSYLASSLKPLFATSIDSDKAKTEKMLSQSITFLLYLALIITTTCLVLSREIILFLSNDQFVAGANTLIILGFATIFIYIGGVLGEIMIAKDMRNILIIISVMILVFNVALNIILIPRYSYLGAALATLISEVLLLILGVFAVSSVIKISPDITRIIKLIFAGAVSSVLSYLLKQLAPNFIPVLIFNLIFFSAFSYLIDAVPKEIVSNYLKSFKQKWSKQ